MTSSGKTPDEMRPDIIEAMLTHVPFDGWTPIAITRAAADLKIDRAMIGLAFPGGALEMIGWFSAEADRVMSENLAAEHIESLKIRERITLAVRRRIEHNTPQREAARRALTLLALPQNAALGAKLAWNTADAMWRAAGDTSTDYNYYSKRTILAGVFSATLLYWLNDDSDGAADTWAFLDRRIEGVLAFEKAKARLSRIGESGKDFVRGLGKLRYGA
ncbi:COQ9 family protein [Govanella unica]|uniref:COQ9 family protein n=1 Tax=Govanella unica TaxID=2975056 RepID=A0A9X3Z816_9PROT|nr:COQ9 family protein [Govania unica]MDA5194865.1 COQ9 family protein [Govania unica]